jgi:NAD(P)-dependent dehydrogenase (short-subunit alcohol dehydrogenase family)
MAWDLEGRSVLITGAARGIGLGTARGLAARGARVALLDIDADALGEAGESVAGSRTFVADVTDEGSMAAAVAGTVEAFGGIDVVMANAGMAPLGLLRYVDPVVFDRAWQVNFGGAWRTIRLTLPHVIERRGYVLAIASLAAPLAAPTLASYGPSKAAVESLANMLRMEVRHLGVDVGCAYFGFMDTDMVRGVEDRPLYVQLRSAIKPPIGKTYPASMAVAAAVKGIENRSRLVYAPKWARGVIAARTLLQRISERDAVDTLAAADAAFAAEVREKGAAEASRPAGAGGAAAMRGATDR